MKKIIFTIIVLVGIFASGCTSSSTPNIDGTAAKIEVNAAVEEKHPSIGDSPTSEGRPTITSGNSGEDATKMGEAGSEVKTMYDGFGNKTEMRTFFSDPLVKLLTLRTNADGQRTAYVYGQNGDVKEIPQSEIETALAAPAAKLAKLAGILSGRPVKVEEAPPLPEVAANYPAEALYQQTQVPSEPSVEPVVAATPTEVKQQIIEEAKPTTVVDRSVELRKMLGVGLMKKTNMN